MLRAGLRLGDCAFRGCVIRSGSGSSRAGDTSSSANGNCAASAPSFSERAPNSVRLNASTIARSLSFSPRRSAMIPIRMSGSRGKEALSDTSRQYRTTRQFRQSSRARRRAFYSAGATISRTPSCVQFIPVNSMRSCVGVSVMAPSRAGGQVNAPLSSRLVTRHSAEPSQTRSFSRSDRFERKMKTSPANGLM